MLSLDSGCEGDCIRLDECYRLDIQIKPLDTSDNQIPTQADGKSSLNIVGKVKFEIQRDKLTFKYEGYAAKNLQAAILCGGAFLERNKIVQELSEKRIRVNNKHFILESSPFCPPTADIAVKQVTFPMSISVPPGESYEFLLPDDYPPDQPYILSQDPMDEINPAWYPQQAQAVGSSMRFHNNTNNFIRIPENVPAIRISPTKPRYQFSSCTEQESSQTIKGSHIPNPTITKKDRDEILNKIEISSNLPEKLKQKLFSIHSEHIEVFNGDLRLGYNGFSGDHTVDFHFKNNIPPPVHYGCVPSYNKREDDVLMQAVIDRLEDLDVVVKAKDAGIIPKFASPAMLVQKNSSRTLGDSYKNLPILEKLKYNRFVLCQNKLNEYVAKIPHLYTSQEETIRIVGSYEYVITSDLTDSFWQRHIAKDKLPYFAFHSPFKGTYLFKRSSQGFLNQSEGLEQLLQSVLQDCTAEGWCRIHADNLYVLGHNAEETIERWEIVLEKIKQNNLKLSPKKTSCFPESLDLLGWTKQGKYLIPDPHRQHCVSISDLPKTAKQLRSFIGSYRTFQKCQEGTAFILKDLEEFLANHSNSANKHLNWTDTLIQKFEEAKKKIKQLDKLYLPKPNDQLVLTSDWSKAGVSATLWAVVDNKFKTVARMSTRTNKNMENMMPCEGETSAVYIAAKCPIFNLPIKASNQRTVCLVDNKTTCQAAKLLQQGKFSSSKIINWLLSSISELNLEFHHMSGKMGQNFTDDYGSRNPASCNTPTFCKVCSFIKECGDMTTTCPVFFNTSNQAIIAAVTPMDKNTSNKLVSDIISGKSTIPFGNKKAMKYLQDQDPDLVQVRRELTSGQRPQTKNTKINSIKRYLQRESNITIAADGCLVSRKFNNKFSSRELIVIPRRFSYGLLYGMHINLQHPSPFQLKKVVDTKFFLLDRDKIIKDIWQSCLLCQSIAHIPKEIEAFKANEIPDHPGKGFTIDILKHAKKLVVVTVDNFSGFLSTCFVKSEDHEHLLEGIIQTVTPFKASTMSTVRVDQAPGFRKLMKNQANLLNIGIKLEFGEVKNKNSLAIVDRKMAEIRQEIRKLAPSNNVLDIRILAQATAIVNEKVRHSGLSAKEILFSRDQLTNKNIPIEDDEIASKTMLKRKQDNLYTGKSKASVLKESAPANAIKGQLVFLKENCSKNQRRDIYMVVDMDLDPNFLYICKLLNTMSDKTPTMQPHNITYKVKQTDIFLAPNQPFEVEYHLSDFCHDKPFFPQSQFPHEDHENNKEPKHPIPGYEEANSEASDDEDDGEDQDIWLIDFNEPVQENVLHPQAQNQEHQPVHLPDYLGDDQDRPLGQPLPVAAHPDPEPYPHDHPVLDQQHHPVWGDLLNLNLNPALPPTLGASIVYYNFKTFQTKRAVIAKTFKTVQRRHPGWYNVIEEGARKVTSVNLGLTRWKYTHHQLFHPSPPPPPPPSPPDQPPPVDTPSPIPQVEGCETLSEHSNEEEGDEDEVTKAFKLSQKLHLFIPTLPLDGSFEPGRRYLIPPNFQYAPNAPTARERIRSISEGDLTNSDATRPSRWTRRIQRLRNFLRRLPKKK